MDSFGKIAVIGSGSWATALARLLLANNERIIWHFRSKDKIAEFIKYRHNPTYLTDVTFDTARIDFYSDINEAMSRADTLVVAVPSPYLKDLLDKVTVDISNKNIVSAVKGIVPDGNMIVTEYFTKVFGVDIDNLLCIGGPCHAEEVALDRLSYLTIGCSRRAKSERFCRNLSGKRMKTIVSTDVAGIEYAAVLKNVYAIAGGMVSGMKTGDNFLAMLVSNAIREMRRFIDAVAPMERDICLSAYLGDLLVTAYSRFSRNHNFGAMIGKGYGVRAAMIEMQQVAEGYYGTKCIHQINVAGPQVDMPILDCVYSILYEDVSPGKAFKTLADTFC